MTPVTPVNRRPPRRTVVLLAGTVALAAVVGVLVYVALTRGASDQHPKPVAVFVGDTYEVKTGEHRDPDRWSRTVAARQGWREVDLGRAGTGYATTAAPGSCGSSLCQPYQSMIEQTAALQPSIVVVCGGQNDWYAYEQDPAKTTATITSFFAALHQRLPRARVIVVGPVEPVGADHEGTVVQVDRVIADAASKSADTYVGMLQPNVLAPPDLVGPDGYHANAAGQAAIAARVDAALTEKVGNAASSSGGA